ncbi:MAG TPA: substrate-binding domain-containing protein [Candidatus Cybelea sp.]|jgi:ABC-type phosphate transport system substrate-binding protein
MNKTLVALALAAVTALTLSACNGTSGGSSGVAPLPNAAGASGHRVNPNDTGAADLHAGGSTFAGFAYNLGDQPVGLATSGPPQPTPGPGSVLASYGGTGIPYYCLTGSGFGRKEFEANNGTATQQCAALGLSPVGFGARQDPLDFVGSDQAMASTECCASGSTYFNGRLTGKVTWGQPFEFPTFGGPLVFPYNQASFAIGSNAIKLSTWTYCAISNGLISDWNDAAITKDNGGSVTGGVSETIHYYFRSDNSGTTYLFTNKLNTSCNQTWPAPFNKDPYQNVGKGRDASWTFGVNQAWPGPGSSGDPNVRFFGESGNPGVIGGIQSDPWGTGYAEGAWAAAAAIAQASVLDTGNHVYVSPTNKLAVEKGLAGATTISYGEGSDLLPMGSTTPWCQLFINPSEFATPPHGAYPIVGLTYWLFYGTNHGQHTANKKKLINFMISNKGQALLGPLEYTPLAASLRSAVGTALKGTASQTACIN